jgi:hypothetical protein
MSAKELIFSVLQKPSLVYPQISYGDQKRVFRWLDSYRILDKLVSEHPSIQTTL